MFEALDASLKTTSKTVEGPQIEEENEGYDPWADWRWQPTHVELRDEKAVLFQTALTQAPTSSATRSEPACPAST